MLIFVFPPEVKITEVETPVLDSSMTKPKAVKICYSMSALLCASHEGSIAGGVLFYMSSVCSGVPL